MKRCLQLAQIGSGHVAPNPMVGAVLVADGKIVGEGYHERFGEAHAEPNAIRSVRDAELLKSCTLYVNLEPCSHYGKTPPCADLIVRSGIPRVIIGTLDPNPKVAGRGVRLLQEAGVEVVVSVLEDECRKLNKRFFIFHEQHRPYVLLKWAQTNDGFIDVKRDSETELPLKVSTSYTTQLTHRMRSENQSILVGTNTALLDNPSLTVRNWTGKHPIRIVIDRSGKIPISSKLLDGSVKTIVYTEKSQPALPNVEFVLFKSISNALPQILNDIFKRNIHSVLVEGGAAILNSFIQQDLWDEANVEISQQAIQQGIPAPLMHKCPATVSFFDKHQWFFYKR